MQIWLNGQFIDEKDAVISAYDHGFLYGLGFFETFRTYAGKPFLLDKHLERMAGGLRELDIAMPYGRQIIEQTVGQLLEANRLEDGYFRLSVSAGTGPLGLQTEPYAQPTVILYVKPLPPVADELYDRGMALQELRTVRNTPEGAERYKSFHYMNSVLGKRELAARPEGGRVEGLFLSERGHLAEGIVSNLFFLRDGTCFTPAVDTGILPGITREAVMDLCREMSIPLETGYYSWQQLAAADEVFMTNSIQELVPITSLRSREGESRQVGNGRIGAITDRLLRAYRKKARQEA
ncbi:4-amino-4-deoxychorismate lyase [Xylanibacillus composti]|uniref:4-amino-4-deoxychorismate lyase n=1 Tax=Xylanibacillus composti TaxID=1572762 RepID=A0A8J4GY42_9BACL|nr:aminodeoxychorismate lyase [Xylanibacillus composti]MDT9725109.1 4-amino-4-deoxychorismate lyase [Xylanibacillus composti]GIQ67318.1 4-amino-4-deoxychorismate lyase [Xylanibacillus composti]